MGSKCFNGEVWTNVHPKIMQAIVDANGEAVDGKVGQDGASVRAAECIRREFDHPVEIVFSYNGTAANVLAMKSLLRPWDTVLAAECAHIHTHECGASEYMLGCKILPIPSRDGKVTPQQVAEALKDAARYQYKPALLALTQPTELGVLYTNEELKALCDTAHANGMQVFVDGARITHAMEAMNTTLREMIEAPGVDVLTWGGTKAGLMFGEMTVFLHPEQAGNLAYSQKQSLQHMDKSKFLGVQFECLLSTGLWRETAGHANRMAKQIEKALLQKGIEAVYPVDTNMVFARVSPAQLEKIRTIFDLNYWDASEQVVRFAATHETTQEMIDRLTALL